MPPSPPAGPAPAPLSRSLPLGLSAVLIAALSSAFASVYFEKYGRTRMRAGPCTCAWHVHAHAHARGLLSCTAPVRRLLKEAPAKKGGGGGGPSLVAAAAAAGKGDPACSHAAGTHATLPLRPGEEEGRGPAHGGASEEVGLPPSERPPPPPPPPRPIGNDGSLWQRNIELCAWTVPPGLALAIVQSASHPLPSLGLTLPILPCRCRSTWPSPSSRAPPARPARRSTCSCAPSAASSRARGA